MRALGLLPLAAALVIGCSPAAAQSVQRTYLPLAQLREGAPASPTAAATPTTTPAGVACAGDRLPVRTLSDLDAAQVDSRPLVRSIRELRETAAPSTVDAATPRLDRIERSTFQLEVEIVALSRLQSGALALTVADPADPTLTALVELPDPACAAVAASPRAADVAAARDARRPAAASAPIRRRSASTVRRPSPASGSSRPVPPPPARRRTDCCSRRS